MSDTNWNKKKEIFFAALNLPEGEIKAFLDEKCQDEGDDGALRGEIERLLAAHFEDDQFIEKPAFQIAPTFDGRRFGSYKIVREIGRGGMGAVFLAERTDGEFEQKVALKIVRQSVADEELKKRFRRERQILANLNHPFIAKLLDGGVSEQGEPFLAMEYVEGVPLPEYADRENLNVEDRLKIFLKICSAVQYAHRNLVVHRDIKPSNILVTKEGEPKLLDFGLAKISDNDSTDLTRTETAFRAFTPAYASPEQISGRNITTASDVYSLGVVLYELLTGTRPFRFENKSFEEILRTIGEIEPARPSSQKSPVSGPLSPVSNSESEFQISNSKAPRPETEDRKLNRRSKIANPKFLRGDLDTIILKALRKEPEQRYESVEQFARDIELYLQNLPILARPQTAFYRAAKFVRRNRIVVSASAFVILSLLMGLSVALWQTSVARAERDRAERRFQDVRRLSNSLLSELSPKIERLPGSIEAREILVKNALDYLDNLAREAQGDEQLQSELAAAYEKIGDLQGNPAKPNLSDFAGAVVSYEKANAIRQNLPPSAENQRLLGENFRFLSAVQYLQNDVKTSLQNSARALRIYENLLAEDPGSVELQTAFLETQIEHGQTYSNNNQYAAAVPLFREALAALEKLDPNDRRIQMLSAKGFSYLGNALSWDGKQTEAEEEMAKAVKIAEELATEYPNDASIRQAVWRVFILASSIYEGGRNEESLRFAQKARQTAEQAVAADEADVQARHNLAKSFSRLGIVSALLDRLPEASAYLKEAERVFAELLEKEPKNRVYQSDLGKLYTRFGDTKEKQGDLDGALAAFRKSAELFEEIARADEANTLARRDLAQSLKSVGKAHLKLGEKEKARQDLQRSLEILIELKARNSLGEFDNQLFEEARAALSESDQ